MTRNDVLKHLCRTVALVYRTQDDYSQASDGFCELCPGGKPDSKWNFQHSGKTLEYVRRAVIKALVADGYTPDLGVLKDEDSA
jgi:hypothetical protein